MTTTACLPPTSLGDIDRIIDLYYYEQAESGMPCGGEGAYCYYGPADAAPLAGTPLVGWVNRLSDAVRATHPDGEDFRVDFDGTSWRGVRDARGGSRHVHLRRLAPYTPRLSDLNMDAAVRELLLGPWLNEGGLVLFCGLTGQGKTVLASACVRSRLERYAGRCVTVEDVIELPLEGLWGRGSCRQLSVDYWTHEARHRGFAGAIRRAYRSFPATRPAILYIGEVRDTETAAEVVKAAANGMLVISTIHAFDPIGALMRLMMLAEAVMGDSACVSLSQGIRMVAHNSLALRGDVAGWGRGAFTGTVLVSDGAASPLANLIRKKQFAQMAQIHSFQQTRLALARLRRSDASALLELLAGNGG